jgi:hypothetical protein
VYFELCNLKPILMSILCTTFIKKKKRMHIVPCMIAVIGIRTPVMLLHLCLHSVTEICDFIFLCQHCSTDNTCNMEPIFFFCCNCIALSLIYRYQFIFYKCSLTHAEDGFMPFSTFCLVSYFVGIRYVSVWMRNTKRIIIHTVKKSI